MKKFASKSGFTLVELIVVIAILGILAGIAVPAYSGYIKKANEAADYTQLDAIKTAAVFKITEEKMPKDVEIVKITVDDSDTDTVTVNAKVGGAAAADFTVNISAYCDKTAFKSDATSAEWTPAAGWKLTTT